MVDARCLSSHAEGLPYAAYASSEAADALCSACSGRSAESHVLGNGKRMESHENFVMLHGLV